MNNPNSPRVYMRTENKPLAIYNGETYRIKWMGRAGPGKFEGQVRAKIVPLTGAGWKWVAVEEIQILGEEKGQ